MNSSLNGLKERFLRHSTSLKPIPGGATKRTGKLNGIRLLVFDFYGTLFLSGVGDIGIDDADKNRTIFNQVFVNCGFESLPGVAEEALQIFRYELQSEQLRLREKGFDPPEPRIERVWFNVLTSLKNLNKIAGNVSDESAREAAVEFEALANPVWPVPGLKGLLDQLSRSPVALGIISNSQFYTPLLFEALTDLTLEEAGFHSTLLHWSFEEQEKKPSLRFYRNYLKKATDAVPGTAANEILYVGNDMLKDIYPASEVGMRTALYAGDRRSLKWRREDDRCRDLEPDIILTDLRQITECI